MKYEKLSERMARRDLRLKNDAYTPVGHIVLELDRLARQVRMLPTSRGMYYDHATCVKIKDVLALIKAAKQ